MKNSSKQLDLRPLRPGFLDIIPRLPAMVSKNKILFKIVSPIKYVFRGFKNIFKKRPSMTRALQEKKMPSNVKNTETTSCDKFNDNFGEQSVYSRGDSLDIPDSWNTQSDNTNIIEGHGAEDKDVPQEICSSCEEDRPVYRTCSICHNLNPQQHFLSSCEVCLQNKPIVKLCRRYHQRQPLINLPESSRNKDLGEMFNQRRLMLRQVSMDCSGKRPTINSCPMCLSIWPMAGDCNCRSCRNYRPIVKYYKSKSHNNAMVYMCPCSKCFHLRPKTKVCEDCRSKKAIRRKNTSFYVILPQTN